MLTVDSLKTLAKKPNCLSKTMFTKFNEVRKNTTITESCSISKGEVIDDIYSVLDFDWLVDLRFVLQGVKLIEIGQTLWHNMLGLVGTQK